MKKLSVILIAVVITIASIFDMLKFIDGYYEEKIKGIYYDEIGNELLVEKNQGLELQRKALERNDNILIYGSSELEGTMISSHPNNIFKNKNLGFQVNLIGRGDCQSIIHAINFQALGKNLKNKKVAFILSPQWFVPKGLKPEGFNMNFSELQFYEFMFNKDIDKSFKMKAAERMIYLNSNTMENGYIRYYSYLYSKDNIVSKSVLNVMMPYYRFKYYTLSIKDKIETYRVLKKYEGRDMAVKPEIKNIDWKEEQKAIVEEAKKASDNNEFGIMNDYYDTYIRKDYDKLKGSHKKDSYLVSSEYEDFKFLLDTCKSIGVKPLFISVPVHGKWYDYCEFSKDDRAGYYKNIREMVSSYGFEILDMSQNEDEEYVLKDIMHLGWKGWLYIDEALVKYYNNN